MLVDVPVKLFLQGNITRTLFSLFVSHRKFGRQKNYCQEKTVMERSLINKFIYKKTME